MKRSIPVDIRHMWLCFVLKKITQHSEMARLAAEMDWTMLFVISNIH